MGKLTAAEKAKLPKGLQKRENVEDLPPAWQEKLGYGKPKSGSKGKGKGRGRTK